MRRSRKVAVLCATIMSGFVAVQLAVSQTQGTRIATPQVVVDEAILFEFVDEPEHHFEQARQALLDKDYPATSAEIRKGTAFLRLEAARANREGKQRIGAAVQELNKLAQAVDRGTVRTTRRLDEVFAGAHYAMAQHHHTKASESQVTKAMVRAGRDLRASAIHLDYGARRAGHRLEQGGVSVVKGARTLAGKLIQGTGVAADEVGNGINSVGREIEVLGKRIVPSKRR